MERSDVTSLIESSSRLADIFGYWPSFHDAEVVDLSLWRGDVKPKEQRYTFPVLRATVHLWEMTNEVDTNGFFVLKNHTLVVFRFRDVQDLNLSGFNHQNVIDDITFDVEPRGSYENGDPLPPYIVVEFVQIFGLAVTFKCFGVEVESAVLCSPEGEPYA